MKIFTNKGLQPLVIELYFGTQFCVKGTSKNIKRINVMPEQMVSDLRG